MENVNDGVAFYPENAADAQAVESREIKVLRNRTQNARLEAIYIDNATDQDEVFSYVLTGKNATKWTFTYGELRTIYAQRQVTVTPESRFPQTGTFTIGPRKNWLYSKSMHRDPEALKQEILELIAFSLTGE